MADSTLTVGEDVFRLWALLRDRGNGTQKVLLDDVIQAFTWDDANALMTGDITLQRPEFGEAVPLRKGDQVSVEVSSGGHGFAELWRMRVNTPSRDLSGTGTFQLANDLDILNRSSDDWKFVKGKARPNGWKTGDIASYVLNRYGVLHAPMPTTSHYVKKYVKTGYGPLSVLADTFRAERVNTGRRFVMRMDHGVVTVTPLRQNPLLIRIRDLTETLTTTDSFREGFATALTVRATTNTSKKDKKGHKKVKHRKIAVGVESAVAISQYGYVHQFYHANDVESEDDARKAGLRRLAQVARQNLDVQLTVEGIPRLRRGDALFADYPEAGLRKMVWVKEARHSVSAGTYTMDLVLLFDNPFKT